MKIKEVIFDVEMIIDHSTERIHGELVKISTHRIIRCLTLDELNSLIRNNQLINERCEEKITFNIRGVTY